MRIKTLDRNNSEKAMSALNENFDIDAIILDPEYKQLRTTLVDKFEKIGFRQDYKSDIRFGIVLKEIFDTCDWFTNRVASDYGFWRYLSLKVIPDLVCKRWSLKQEDHFWKNSNRIWLYSIWRFVSLGWQGNAKATEEVLTRPQFSTDSIVNMVERAGRKGTNEIVYTHILNIYAGLKEEDLKDCKADKFSILFRRVMCLNTIRSIVMEPGFCKGEEKGYVQKLYKSLGIPMKEF